MSTTNQIADSLEKSGIPFVRIEGVADGTEYWGLTVFHENVHAEVRECSDWVEMKAWHYTPEQFMDMLVGAGTCTIEPHGYYDEQHGIYTCSSCGQQWQFEVEGPMEHGWTCCPHCRARIKEDAE